MRRLLPLFILAALAVAGTPAGAAPGWRWPLDGAPVVLRGFQPPPTPYAAGHRGVDLAAPVGAPVRAAGAGVIGYAGRLAGRGVVTVIHGELRTTYEPVSATVHRGDRVRAGDVIGHLAAGAHCDARACLHWGLLRGSVYLDPLALVGAQRIRLLPVAGIPPPWAGASSALGATSAGLLAGGFVRRRNARRRRGRSE